MSAGDSCLCLLRLQLDHILKVRLRYSPNVAEAAKFSDCNVPYRSNPSLFRWPVICKRFTSFETEV